MALIKSDNLPPNIRDSVLAQMGKDNIAKVAKARKRTDKADLEHAVQDACLSALKALGYCVWRQNVGVVKIEGRYVKFGTTGAADITGMMLDGRRLEVETKRRKGGVQSPDQKAFQAMIEASGGVYILAASVDDLLAGLEKAGGEQ